jgi:hypothetical protein
MDPMSVLLQFVSGAIGGNLTGFLWRARTPGTLVNTLLGGVGGIGGGSFLGPTLGASSFVSSLLGSGRGTMIVTSLVVGAVLPLIAGLTKKKA